MTLSPTAITAGSKDVVALIVCISARVSSNESWCAATMASRSLAGGRRS
jgi:hypothetical protein